MPMTIKNANNGTLAKVDDEQRIWVNGVISHREEWISKHNGQVFVWGIEGYSYSDGDTILLVKNIDPNRNFHIVNLLVQSSVKTVALVHFPTCNTPAGTTVTGVNVNRTSTNEALAIAKSNETNNTPGDQFVKVIIKADTPTKLLDANGSGILGYNDCIAIDLATAGTSCYAFVCGYYINEED